MAITKIKHKKNLAKKKKEQKSWKQSAKKKMTTKITKHENDKNENES